MSNWPYPPARAAQTLVQNLGNRASAACAATVLLFVPFWIYFGKGTILTNLREDFVAYAIVLFPHLALAVACALAPGVLPFGIAMAVAVIAGLALALVTAVEGVLGMLNPANDVNSFVVLGIALLIAQVVLFRSARAGLIAARAEDLPASSAQSS